MLLREHIFQAIFFQFLSGYGRNTWPVQLYFSLSSSFNTSETLLLESHFAEDISCLNEHTLRGK